MVVSESTKVEAIIVTRIMEASVGCKDPNGRSSNSAQRRIYSIMER